ncbi:Hypothetical predicted protein [Mytilus galloprovincialis]|uniref:Uncharacterized protein n=1 Tax=Mytilus galloprovincialis TaxID=29158 RepID=A0A8B6E2Y9_MYTGA|nr:Hypothetical predicted protein [Mytilus galloprovincialis]
MKIVRLFVTILEISFYIWITTVADTDYREDTFINGTGVLNCTTQRQKIHIESVDYNASICSGTNGSIMQHFTNLCNGKSVCEFVVRDTINDLNLTCLANETAANLFDIDYYCTHPIVKIYTEGERAHLTCSIEYRELIVIMSINFIHGTCTHSEKYGIGNLCNGKTNCSFDVSNSNIGSSCGANRTAMFEVEYKCIRNGGWSDWNTSASCPVTCGGGFRNVTRTCSNPYPNEIGEACTGVDFEEQICNTHNCIDQNTACLKATVNWNCPDGLIIVDKAIWETSRACGDGYQSFQSLNVQRKLKSTCENRRNCTFLVDDHNFGESCSTSVSRCTIFDYVYSCIKARWDVWSSWSECTRSCGSGIQKRQRQCLNQMNTTDGYITDCEGIGTGSRACNTELCPSTELRKSTQFNVPEDKRIAITKGDIIGWFDSGSNIVGFHDCLQNNHMCPLSYRLSNDIGEGDVVDITSLSETSGRSYTVNYSTVENRPIAFDLPSNPMYIPDHLNMDALVMEIPIYDADYGDYVQDYNLDYDNEYFYFDTKLRNVYVKKELPHTVGQMSFSLNITLTVQDSCYNEVTSNFTIIVYNVPPVISGLQNSIEVDPATIDRDPYLVKFQVKDPSGDNVSCMINDTNAATELFYLQLDDIGMTKNYSKKK